MRDYNEMTKQELREQVAIDTAKYIKAGGKIQKIPYGKGGNFPKSVTLRGLK